LFVKISTTTARKHKLIMIWLARIFITLL
jgi:hypothetical protein